MPLIPLSRTPHTILEEISRQLRTFLLVVVRANAIFLRITLGSRLKVCTCLAVTPTTRACGIQVCAIDALLARYYWALALRRRGTAL